MLDVPADLIWFVPAFAARRRSIGTRENTRKLSCYRQVLFRLARFRDKAGIRRLGAGFGLSQATAYRSPRRTRTQPQPGRPASHRHRYLPEPEHRMLPTHVQTPRPLTLCVVRTVSFGPTMTGRSGPAWD